MTWLEPWLATPLFQELRDASRARRPIERNLEWTIAWPLDSNHSTVVRGCTEAIYRDHRGRWRPVIVRTPPRAIARPSVCVSCSQAWPPFRVGSTLAVRARGFASVQMKKCSSTFMSTSIPRRSVRPLRNGCGRAISRPPVPCHDHQFSAGKPLASALPTSCVGPG